jgi:hypothetical protein
MKVLCTAGLVVIASAVQVSGGEVTPAGTAMKFYLLANQGECGEAEKLFTPESVAVIKKTLGAKDGFALFCADKGTESPLVTLTAKTAKSGVERATVEVTRTYEMGMAMDTDVLVKQGSAWKIVVGESQSASKPRK